MDSTLIIEKLLDQLTGKSTSILQDLLDALCDGECLTAIGVTDEDVEQVELAYNTIQNLLTERTI